MYGTWMIVLIGVFSLYECDGRLFGLGKCPEVHPVSDFDINKLIGHWYVVERAHSFTSCITYDIEKSEEKPGHYKITETRPSSHLMSLLTSEVHFTGHLTVSDVNFPAKMNLHHPFELGSTKFIVFMADYDRYVAVFTCKKHLLTYKWSAEILSRTPSLNMDYIDKIRTRLSSNNIDSLALTPVKHHDCLQPYSKEIISKTADKVMDNKNIVEGPNASKDTQMTAISSTTEEYYPIDVRTDLQK